MFRALFCLSLLASAAAAAAEPQAGTPAPAPAAAQAQSSPDVVVRRERPDDQKRVCRSSTATGSIMPTRTCRTKREWDEITERSVAALDRMRKDKDAQRHTRAMMEAER